ncbi:predicted protein [Naegleria gruberi]|uniref:Predicted protein n=1 Tax=Naegleria gruberi TaxID=5762 RepID=D2V1K2_NAEGR|nr:uncharacterized protein NAEGRDRAFT_45908 [Naegleria gruberi]EFC49325.1 predicted protein [Naegleria gruberi]|eukprot:XP_002682069.1 predicted protein [Naegleria gruberi strain NEG-M]
MRRIRKVIKLSNNTPPQNVDVVLSLANIHNIDTLYFNDWTCQTQDDSKKQVLQEKSNNNDDHHEHNTMKSEEIVYDEAVAEKKLITANKLRLFSNRILRDLLKEEFKVTHHGVSALKETLIQEIITKLYSSSSSSSTTTTPKEDEISKAEEKLINDWTEKAENFHKSSNSSENTLLSISTLTDKSNTIVPLVVSFKRKQVKNSYTQLSREEMLIHAKRYTTNHPQREYGSKSLYCKQNKISIHQLGRILAQFDDNCLTGKEKLSRGCKSPKLTAEEITSVILEINSQRDDVNCKQISDKTIYEAITKITKKEVSLSYCHKFGKTYFEKVKTQMVKTESPYEIKSLDDNENSSVEKEDEMDTDNDIDFGNDVLQLTLNEVSRIVPQYLKYNSNDECL